MPEATDCPVCSVTAQENGCVTQWKAGFQRSASHFDDGGYVMRCISVERRGLACAGKLPCRVTTLPVEGRGASVLRHTLVTVEAPALRSSLQRKGDLRCQQGLQGWVQGRASAAELRKKCLRQRVVLQIVAMVPKIVPGARSLKHRNGSEHSKKSSLSAARLRPQWLCVD